MTSRIMYALQFSSHCFPMSVQFLGSSRFINCTTSVNKSSPLLLNRIKAPFHSCPSVISLGKLQCVPSDMIQKGISSALPRFKANIQVLAGGESVQVVINNPVSSVPPIGNELRGKSEKEKHSTNLSVSTSMMKDSSTQTESHVEHKSTSNTIVPSHVNGKTAKKPVPIIQPLAKSSKDPNEGFPVDLKSIKKEKDCPVDPPMDVKRQKVLHASRSIQRAADQPTETTKERGPASPSLNDTKSAVLSEAQSIDLLSAVFRDLPHPPVDSEMGRLRVSDPQRYLIWRLGVATQVAKLKIEKK